MRYPFLILFTVLYLTTVGQGIPDDLPKPVVRALNNEFKKQVIVLKELQAGEQKMISDKYYAIHADGADIPAGYLHLATVNTCRTGGCSLSNGPAGGDPSSEYFDYLILFTAEFAVETVQIFNYQASYGHEIAARGWLKQFQGFRGEKSLEPGKNIDSISGATVSVHAITNDVQWKTRQLREMVQHDYSSSLSKP